jgi:hypothetical protein
MCFEINIFNEKYNLNPSSFFSLSFQKQNKDLLC